MTVTIPTTKRLERHSAFGWCIHTQQKENAMSNLSRCSLVTSAAALPARVGRVWGRVPPRAVRQRQYRRYLGYARIRGVAGCRGHRIESMVRCIRRYVRNATDNTSRRDRLNRCLLTKRATSDGRTIARPFPAAVSFQLGRVLMLSHLCQSLRVSTVCSCVLCRVVPHVRGPPQSSLPFAPSPSTKPVRCSSGLHTRQCQWQKQQPT